MSLSDSPSGNLNLDEQELLIEYLESEFRRKDQAEKQLLDLYYTVEVMLLLITGTFCIGVLALILFLIFRH